MAADAGKDEGTPVPEQEDEELPDAPAATNGEEKAVNGDNAKVKLEDLFNDDDDDEKNDEFPMSSATDSKIPSSPPAVTPQAPPPPGIDPNVMSAFYQRLFPFRQLFQWLNHGMKPGPDFGNREFAFTLQNDAYLRYQSFTTGDLLRREILRLNPSRFEIGPVYSTNPRDRKTLKKSGAFRPVSKELVFDIDLTDYDDTRTCCTKANICPKCWAFVTMAIKVIDTALRDDFGFEHIMWVYSGRRGAHAWVCDKRARDLPDDRRRAIAGYLELVRGGAQAGKRVNLKRPLHPHIARSLEILKPHFATTILDEQDVFISTESEAHSERLLSLLPDKPLVTALRNKWSSSPSRSSSSKWADIDPVAQASGSNSLDPKELLEAKQDIVLEYTYPRLDADVSKKQIHLLKSPFVVHPGTGRVCVPIDVSCVEAFEPQSVPKVADLLDEINEWDAKNKGEANGDGEEKVGEQLMNGKGRVVQDYEKTSLKPYVEYFRQFVAALNKDERGGKREREEQDGSPEGGMEF